MNDHERLCFVIGPMGNGRLSRLQRLAVEVIQPLVEPYHFSVETPDHPDVGRIMDQVLLSLDRADLLVADLTGNNPNVLYELAVYHMTGRPYITVRDTAQMDEDEQTPFDIQAYRFVEVDLDMPDAARDTLAPVVRGLFEQENPQSWYSNPITDFYHNPATHLRYGTALAENYIRNFFRKAVDAVFEERGTVTVDGTEVPEDRPRRVEILLPSDFTHARHRFIEQRLLNPGRLVRAAIKTRTRDFTLYADPRSRDVCRLIDIPTILATLRTSIEQRMGPQARQGRIDRALRAQMERVEARRFRTELSVELQSMMEERVYTTDQIRLVDGVSLDDPSLDNPSTDTLSLDASPGEATRAGAGG